MTLNQIPEEQIRKFVRGRVKKEFDEVAKKTVRHKLEEQLLDKVEEIVREILGELEEQGVDTDRANCDVTGITIKNVLEALSEDSQGSYGTRTEEIPVGGRNNRGQTTTIESSVPSEPPTKTVEVPIEGGDVEDPDTMEVEKIDPEAGLLWDAADRVLDEAIQLNVNQGTEENSRTDPSDIPAPGEPWYDNSGENSQGDHSDCDVSETGLPFYQ